MTDESGFIVFERRGPCGHIRLNRPRALNALTPDMIRRMSRTLGDWAADEAVRHVLVTAEGERAFCAGGDIKWVYLQGRAGDVPSALAFFHDEYQLNAMIARFPKPYVSLIDGIVMGGGFGISAHGSHRIAGETYRFAMPEVGLGLFPDVGATYALSRFAGQVGRYLALSGARIDGHDARAIGLATHQAPRASFAAIEEALCTAPDVEAALAPHVRTSDADLGSLVPHRALIAECFGASGGVAAVLARLDAAAARGSAFAAETAATIRTRSPTSLIIADEQMRRGASLSFPEAMLTEYRIVTRVLEGHDFYEGVRALLIDRDNAPGWTPAQIEAIDREAILARYFAPLPAPEPQFGGPSRSGGVTGPGSRRPPEAYGR